MQESQNTTPKVDSLDDLGLKVLSPLEQNHVMGGLAEDSVTVVVVVTVVVTVSDLTDEL